MKFFKDKNGHVVVGQMPNIPLIVWLLATVLQKLVKHGGAHTALIVIALVSIIIWATLEIVKGASPFRRTLGALVLILSIYSRLK